MSDPRRVALVTGASQGLGKAIALRLAKDGLHVSLNDIPSKTDALKEVASLVEQHGVRSAVFPGDVTKESDVKAMIDGTADALGGFDVVRADCGSRWKACSASPPPAPSSSLARGNSSPSVSGFQFASVRLIRVGRLAGALDPSPSTSLSSYAAAGGGTGYG